MNAQAPNSEIHSFSELWDGGFYEGDPLDPVGKSQYRILGYTSVIHAIYQSCIKPYISPETVALEIGPGRGAWTKTLLGCREVWCLDALSAEHNRFWEYLGSDAKHVMYHQVHDFGCTVLPKNKYDYLFSFGTFCHISPNGFAEYLENLYPKLKPGAHAFIMYADYDKYRRAWNNIDALSVASIAKRYLRRSKLNERLMRMVLGWIADYINGRYCPLDVEDLHDLAEGDEHFPGRWYHMAPERLSDLLTGYGYSICELDVGITHRDPIVHFMKT